jgi:hypothetical protein
MNYRRRTADGGQRTTPRSSRVRCHLPSAVCRPAMMLIVSWVAAGCGPSLPNTDMRAFTPEFEFRIASDIVPPRALEQIHYTITVRDIKTHEPIANGQGRIFATNADAHSIYDGFAYGPEVGVYHATLMFVTAGDWAMNVQFRRDSTKALIKPDNDWRQTVLVAAEPGSSKP